jgi:iron complex outermembrane receptor protein
MKKTFILFPFFLLALSTLKSQEKTDSVAVNLSELQVNANRNKLYSEMGRVLTVVNKAEIARQAIQSIDQLLDYVAGLDIRQRGVDGTQADISVRGGSFDQVLVLLNGINITDPQTGHFNLDIPLNLSDVSRVEILEGSSARVLGPNAFSGAINIVTENHEKHALNAELVGGSFNYYAQSVSGSMGSDLFHTFVSVSHKSSSGYITNTDFDLSSAFLQSILNTKNAGKFDLQLAGQLKAFGSNGFYTLAYPNQFENSKTFLTALSWSMNKGKFEYAAQAYWRQHHDRFELFRDDIGAPSWYTGHNYHLTDVTGGKISGSYLSMLGKTTLGIDLRNEHIYSNVLGDLMAQTVAVPFENNQFFTRQADRFLATTYFDHSVNINRWYLSFGGAATNSTSFGLYSYGGFDIAYALNDNARIFFDANSAVRLPTFTDLYYNSATQIANPNLKPEQSKTFEIGTKLNRTDWSLNATAYYRLGNNIIDWVKSPDSTKWQSRNLTNVDALGADISFDYFFHHSFLQKVSVSYSYLTLDKSAVNFDSKYALDYLKHKIVVAVHHKIWDKLSASWTGSYSDRAGQYTDFTSNKLVNYSPYFLLNGRLLWSQKKYDIFVDANNILNASYADYGGLIQPGTSVNIGVRLKLN